MNKLIKIILSLLLVICVLDMPYGYYHMVRYLGLVGFGIMAYNAYEKERLMEGVLFAGLAILFQPFFKISLGRLWWNILDVGIAIGLISSLLIKQKKKEDPKSI